MVVIAGDCSVDDDDDDVDGGLPFAACAPFVVVVLVVVVDDEETSVLVGRFIVGSIITVPFWCACCWCDFCMVDVDVEVDDLRATYNTIQYNAMKAMSTEDINIGEHEMNERHETTRKYTYESRWMTYWLLTASMYYYFP